MGAGSWVLLVVKGIVRREREACPSPGPNVECDDKFKPRYRFQYLNDGRHTLLIALVQKMLSELKASTLYDADVLADGIDGSDYSDHYDVCREVPKEGSKDVYDPLSKQYESTFLPAFCGHVEYAQITAVVKVVLRYEQESAHIDVVGPSAFQLCKGLQVLRWGLSCRHRLVALFTRLKQPSEFQRQLYSPSVAVI